MLKTVEGIYRHGRIELTEEPRDVREETRVLVTFLEPMLIDLRARGIDEGQAAELRARLGTFTEDWESPEMSIYDDYDAALGAGLDIEVPLRRQARGLAACRQDARAPRRPCPVDHAGGPYGRQDARAPRRPYPVEPAGGPHAGKMPALPGPLPSASRGP